MCCDRLGTLCGQTCCASKVIERIAVGAGCRAQWWRGEMVGELARPVGRNLSWTAEMNIALCRGDEAAHSSRRRS